MWNYKTILLLAILLLSSQTCFALEPYFVSCEDALSSRPFQKLQNFYDSHPDEGEPDECFRLNNNEFLVTVNQTSRQAQGLYFFNAKIKSYGPAVENWAEPGIHVVTEFKGPHEKRFVLFESRDQNTWYSGVSYYLLYLTPYKSGKPYVFSTVLSAEAYWSKEGEACEQSADKPATDIDSYKVEQPGTDDTHLVFNVKEWNCTSNNKSYLRRVFKITSDGAVEIEAK